MLQAVDYIATPNKESIQAAVQSLKAGYGRTTLLALVAEAEAACIPLLQNACNDCQASLYGALFPQVIAEGKLTGTGIVLARITAPAYGELWDRLEDQSAATKHTDDFIAAAADALGSQSPLNLFLVFDGLLPNIGSMLDDLYLRLADRVGYVGANSGSETFQPTPCVFNNDRLVGNAALVLLLESASTPLLEHGYALPENQITATSTAGNCISQIDWQPAFDVYRRVVRDQYDIEITRENFYTYGVHFPFGIILASGEILVRIPVALTDDGAIYCVGEIPANSLLTLLHASDETDFHTVGQLHRQLPQSPPGRATLAFYCAGRRLHLGQDKAQQELHKLESDGVVRPLWGALTLGEIGCPANTTYPHFHNATIVVVPPAS